jgi:hypothetical protein
MEHFPQYGSMRKTMTIFITRDSLRRANACYKRKYIDELVPPDGIAVNMENVEKMRTLGVPDTDLHWALCYATGDHPREFREHACWCAMLALEAERDAARVTDKSSWAAVKVAELFARDEASDEDLVKARRNAKAGHGAARSARHTTMKSANDAAEGAAWHASLCFDSMAAAVDDLAERLESLSWRLSDL